MLSLTDAGRKALGINTRTSHRPGGAEHRYWVRRLAHHLQATGYRIAEEVPIGGGKTIDLVAARDGKRIAFEIETGKSDAATNVWKCVEAGMDRVVVVATTALTKIRVEPALPNDPRVVCVTTGEALAQY